jgi:hypothetical protein
MQYGMGDGKSTWADTVHTFNPDMQGALFCWLS